LDSWDQGTGAIDDGFGVAAVLGSAKSIIESGLKPQRTLRFVLFTGEEQGLLGSRAYTSRHQAEMKNVVCTLVLDWGYGPITKYLLGGHAELTSALDELFPVLTGVVSPQVGKGFLTYTDGFSFTLAGVPEIGLFQDSPDYGLLGHSAADTLDKTDPEVLARDSAALAISDLWFADYPVQVASHWSPAKTAQMLDDQRRFLQALELWPF
jgi:carboxypeptidase Q